MSNSIKTINPTNGETLETYTLMSSAEAKQVVDACYEAFLDWRLESLESRAKTVKAIGQAMQKHKEELADLMVKEMGKLPSQARQEVDLCTGICDYTAEHGAPAWQWRTRFRDLLPNGCDLRHSALELPRIPGGTLLNRQYYGG